jgi:hypothetical protein
MHPTPLRGPKIRAILKVGFSRAAFPIYSGGRVMRRLFGGLTPPPCVCYTWPVQFVFISDISDSETFTITPAFHGAEWKGRAPGQRAAMPLRHTEVH